MNSEHRPHDQRHLTFDGAMRPIELSPRRAEWVDSALAGHGEEFPVAANSSDTNRALNRRFEVTLAVNDQPVRSRR